MRVCVTGRGRERERQSPLLGEARQPVYDEQSILHRSSASIWIIPLIGTHPSDYPGAFPSSGNTCVFVCSVCVCGSQDNVFSPGEQGERMTSVAEGLAGRQRGSPDHGLPSLVSRVSDQTAPNHPENGDDERTLDRMGTKRWTDVCREM